MRPESAICTRMSGSPPGRFTLRDRNRLEVGVDLPPGESSVLTSAVGTYRLWRSVPQAPGVAPAHLFSPGTARSVRPLMIIWPSPPPTAMPPRTSRPDREK